MIVDYHHLQIFHHQVVCYHKIVQSLLPNLPVGWINNSNVFMHTFLPLIVAVVYALLHPETLSYSVAKLLRILDTVTMEIMKYMCIKQNNQHTKESKFVFSSPLLLTEVATFCCGIVDL